MKPNIVLTFKSIKGDFILVDIDKSTREFKSLSQEDIIWFSQDLINKSVVKNEIAHIELILASLLKIGDKK